MQRPAALEGDDQHALECNYQQPWSATTSSLGMQRPAALECNDQQPWNVPTAFLHVTLTNRPADLGCVEPVAALQVVENVTTFVNILRAAGHSDENIQGVFDGWPLCWTTRELWDEFRQALGK
jgi:hypothetical protein